MRVRNYLPPDQPSVVALWKKVLPDAAPHNEPVAAIGRKVAAGDGLFFVATIDELVVGTVMGGYDGHRGWIYSLAVLPSHQRRGIGAALVHHIEQALAARGCPKVNLQVRASNSAVVAFYESLGYAVEPRISLGKCL
jgi:ribosomal protein S18 acetylase RimI-like enzyme